MSSRSPRKPHGAWAQGPGRREYRTGAAPLPAAPGQSPTAAPRGLFVTVLVGSKALQARAACGRSCCNVKTTTLCQTAVRPPGFGERGLVAQHSHTARDTRSPQRWERSSHSAPQDGALPGMAFDLGKSLWMGIRDGGSGAITKWQKEGLTRNGAGGVCVCAFVNSFDVPSAGWFSAFNPVFSLAVAQKQTQRLCDAQTVS